MILLSAQNIQKSFGTNTVLKDASLVLQDGQRLGLVGVNGCGKSTLMKIIAGMIPYDGGTLTMQKGLRLGYLAQQGMVTPGKTVLEELEAVFEPVVAMEERLRQLEQDMAHTADNPEKLRQLGNQYDQLTRTFEESNGYGWRSTVQGVLAGLGFRKEQQSQLAELLSGGERVRCMLSKMMLSGANFLILDEPTNHLDLESITSLNNGMTNFTGTMLFASKDHQLVSTVANRIIEIADGKIVFDKRMTYEEYLQMKLGD